MVDTDRLKRLIKLAGWKVECLAKDIKISKNSMSGKLNNKTKFTVDEMFRLADLIGLPGTEIREIFYRKEVVN